MLHFLNLQTVIITRPHASKNLQDSLTVSLSRFQKELTDLIHKLKGTLKR